MDQIKIGKFLKHLRKEKGLTQEQLAEQFFVSSRTVSRWETGSNMPDLDILIELADFYNADIREIIDGERKSNNMESETKNTLKKVAEYAAEENKKIKTRITDMMLGAAILLLFSALLFEGIQSGFLPGFIPEKACYNVMMFSMGLSFAVLIINILYLNGFIEKIKNLKNIKKNT
ncbi:MAG: helix-turn-helix domain-containing protein [Ruminococcaceae bacterium]|nr:helix-turn-helix domain-containing protein [Oscillospiraceae bacterium]